MSLPMSAERRTVACLLLLSSALPLLFELLPERVELAAAPLLVLLATVTAMLVPSRSWLQALGWVLGSTAVVLLVVWQAPIESLALLAVLALGLAVVALPSLVSTAVLAVATAILAILLGAELWALEAVWGTTMADRVGQLALSGWSLWQASSLVQAIELRREARARARAVPTVDESVARDRKSLLAIAKVVADPSLTGPVTGAGLASDGLGIAARVDPRWILLGFVEGEPLATLTVGWTLVVAARAGMTDPVALIQLARTQLDEVAAPQQVRWLALWNRRSGRIVATVPTATELHRCSLEPRGPIEQHGAVGGRSASDALERLFAVDHDPDELAHSRGWAGPIATWVALVGASWAVPWVAPHPLVGPACLIAMLVAHQLIRAVVTTAAHELRSAHDELGARVDAHDEIRFSLARLHGSLLPYRLVLGNVVATAHRLRGEVLDGAFADMFIDRGGVGRIVAGEVAGRGIAARFLGLAAQTIARVRVTAGGEPDDLEAELRPRLVALANALRFPVRLRTGAVTFSPEGRCAGGGSLRGMVCLQDPASLNAEIRSLCALADDTVVYLTPAPARPGPDDEAPELLCEAAAERVLEQLRRDGTKRDAESLASLFSRVFDGVHAPAHGTLIELRRSYGDEDHADDREHDEPDHGRAGASLPTIERGATQLASASHVAAQ